jgi:hypothetical protein
MLDHRDTPTGMMAVATIGSHLSAAAQSGGAPTGTRVPGVSGFRASSTTGSTSPRDSFVLTCIPCLLTFRRFWRRR